MITLLIILVWIAIALVYAIQFQIIRDYRPKERYFRIGYPTHVKMRYYCILERESIFKFPFFKRLK